MKELILKNNEVVISSRTVAKKLGRLHKNVLRDIKEILESSEMSLPIYESRYSDKQSKLRKEYLLTKDGFIVYMFNIRGFLEFKMAYINLFNEMEKRLGVKNVKSLPEALRLYELEFEKNQKLEKEIYKYSSKLEYQEKILKSKSTLTVTQIASNYGMTAIKFNKLLHLLRVQYKVNKQWILYRDYKDKLYTDSQTIDINGKAIITTKWTQKGALFLYELLKNHNIYPMTQGGEMIG